jgi:hypothetical protein
MASSDNIAIYNWHPFQKKTLLAMSLFSFVCAGGSAFFFIHSTESTEGIVSVCLCGLFLLCGTALLMSTRTKINFSAQILSRETLALGRYTVWRKNLQFGEFNAVMVKKTAGENSSDYFVGLNYLSGRKLWITYFPNIPDGFPCSQADHLAEQLSRDLQMPIKRPV